LHRRTGQPGTNILGQIDLSANISLVVPLNIALPVPPGAQQLGATAEREFSAGIGNPQKTAGRSQNCRDVPVDSALEDELSR